MTGRGCFMPLTGIALIILLCVLCACSTTKYIVSERAGTDTVYVSKAVRDSVYVHDSVATVIRNDTVWKDRWHTEIIDKSRVDTVYRARTDSVYVEVEKPLTLRQRAGITAGTVVLPVLLAAFIICIFAKKFF